MRCSCCVEYGHKKENCRKQIQRQVWVPKKKPEDPVSISPDKEQAGWITVRSRQRKQASIVDGALG